MPPTLAALALACFAPLAPAARAQEWTRFRGPDGAGESDATGIPAVFTAEDFAWRVPLAGRGHSSPVIWGERIFLTCADEARATRWVVCHASADGAELWRREERYEPHGQHRLNAFASSTPTVDAERVYVLWTTGGGLVALALDHEGRVVWRRELGAFQAKHGSGSSPVLAGGVLVVQNDNEGSESFLLGLDPETGDTRWRRERNSGRASYSTPVVRRRPDGGSEVIFASTSHGLTCLDPTTGALRWERSDLFRQRCVGSPAIAGGVVFATAGQGGGGQESAALELPAEPSEEPPAVRYNLRRALPYVPTPVAHGEHLFLWSDGGVVSCVAAASGEELWRERVDGDYFASPIRVGDVLFATSNGGELVVLAAEPRFELLNRLDLGEPTQATPAVSGGVLYLRTERHLIAVRGE